MTQMKRRAIDSNDNTTTQAWHGKPAVTPQAPVSLAENLQTSGWMTALCKRPSAIRCLRTVVQSWSHSTWSEEDLLDTISNSTFSAVEHEK